MSKGRWSLVAAAAILAIAIQVSSGVLLWHHIRPRLPAVGTAAPTLDQAIASVVAAAGDTAAVTVSDLVPSAACQDTRFAKGRRYTRTAELYVNSGDEDTLITRIAAALPADEHPQRGAPGGGTAPLTAELGGGVNLRVGRIDQGWVAATATTTCRTAGHPQTSGSTPPPVDATTAITSLLTALGTTPAGWHIDTVACPTGQIVTVDALSQATTTDDLPSRLAAVVPADNRQFTSISNRLAWRQQNVSTIVAASDDGTHITVQRTTGC